MTKIAKFSGTNTGNGRAVIGIGMTAETVESLKSGQDICIALERMGLPFIADLLIIYGETEEALADKILPSINTATVIRTSTESTAADPAEEPAEEIEIPETSGGGGFVN